MVSPCVACLKSPPVLAVADLFHRVNRSAVDRFLNGDMRHGRDRLVALLEAHVARTVKNRPFIIYLLLPWHRAVHSTSTTRAWPITRLALGLQSQRTAVQVRDFYMFDVVVRCRNSFRHGIDVQHCLRPFSPDPAQPSAFLRQKMATNSYAPMPRQDWQIRLPLDLPVLGNRRKPPWRGQLFGR